MTAQEMAHDVFTDIGYLTKLKTKNKNIMKFEVKIQEMSHDELVDLFSTALYSNPAFECDYSREERDKVAKENDCYEDVIAKILLNGGSVDVIDRYSEEGNEPYGDNAFVYWDEDEENYIYPITLVDVVIGLELAWKSGEYERVTRFANEDFAFDMIDADVLLQYICYGDIIYG